MLTPQPCPDCKTPMRFVGRWKFDHEEGDTPHETAQLRRFAAMGIELGAWMIAHYCHRCDTTHVDFVTNDP